MRAISLFSGVGGFEIGFDRAGIKTVLQVEQDKHALSVLERHWLDTERLTDVRDLTDEFRVASGNGRHQPGGSGSGSEREPPLGGDNGSTSRDELRGCDSQTRSSGGIIDAPSGIGINSDAESSVDLIYGGFPCQDVSVAGKRSGLAGERSGLWFEFERILSELRPRWAVIENVPGLLSSNKGNDFRVILNGLCELGYSVGWTILDAQNFGVPQRRRRVFVVAGLGVGSVRSVLSLCESCGGNLETGGTPGEKPAYALTSSVRGTGDGHGNAWNSNYVAHSLRAQSQLAHREDVDTLIADTLRNHPRPGSNSIGATVVASTLRSRESSPGVNMPGRGGEDDTNLIALSLTARDGKGIDPSHNNGTAITNANGVRRLTPRECERLMGWPDDWTRYAADGSEIADSHRYRMIGNGVVSTVAEWIGRQLVAVDALA